MPAGMVTVSCPVCGLLSEAHGVDGQCPAGHAFEVSYGQSQDGRPVPSSVRAKLTPPLPPKG
jgi:hypothetical protein